MSSSSSNKPKSCPDHHGSDNQLSGTDQIVDQNSPLPEAEVDADVRGLHITKPA